MICSVTPRGLRDYFERVVWHRRIDGNEKTAYQYRNTISFFERFVAPQSAAIDDLESEELLLDFLRWRMTDGGRWAATKCRTNLLRIAGHAFKKRHIETMPEVPTIPVVLPAPIALRPKEWERLYWSSTRMLGDYKGVCAAYWWRAILLMFVLTGERTEATLSLRWEWLDSHGWLKVPADARKGRRKARAYHLPAVLLASLEKLRPAGNDMIFAKPFGIDQFYEYYGKLLRYAGLPDDRRHKPKCLRSTFGSYVSLVGGNPTAELGHESPATFARHYDDRTLTAGNGIAEKVAAALGLG